MPSRKVLRGVAHNLGHSFLSTMNYYDGDYIVEWLYKAAKAHTQPRVVIDFLSARIQPPLFELPAVVRSVKASQPWFFRDVVAAGASMDHVRSCTMELEFDLDVDLRSSDDPDLHLPVYKRVMSIGDDRGVIHSKEVVEWWKY